MAGMAGWYNCSLPVTLLAIQQSTWLKIREGGSQKKIGVLIPGELGRDPHSTSGLFQEMAIYFSLPLSHMGTHPAEYENVLL